MFNYVSCSCVLLYRSFGSFHGDQIVWRTLYTRVCRSGGGASPSCLNRSERNETPWAFTFIGAHTLAAPFFLAATCFAFGCYCCFLFFVLLIILHSRRYCGLNGVFASLKADWHGATVSSSNSTELSISWPSKMKIRQHGPLPHRFSKCPVRSPRAPREKPRGSASYSFTCNCPKKQ